MPVANLLIVFSPPAQLPVSPPSSPEIIVDELTPESGNAFYLTALRNLKQELFKDT